MQPFISVADLEAYTDRDDLTGTDIAAIIVDSACEIVRGYIGQQVNLARDDVLNLDGSGSDQLLLPETPVIAVTEVVVGEDTLDPSEDYGVDLNAGILYRTLSGRISSCWWPLGYGNVQVTYDHGYAVSESDAGDDQSTPPFQPKHTPSDIRIVALGLATRLLNLVGVDTTGVSSETIGNYSYTLQSGAAGEGAVLSPYECQALSRYRRRRQF